MNQILYYFGIINTEHPLEQADVLGIIGIDTERLDGTSKEKFSKNDTKRYY